MHLIYLDIMWLRWDLDQVCHGLLHIETGRMRTNIHLLAYFPVSFTCHIGFNEVKHNCHI